MLYVSHFNIKLNISDHKNTLLDTWLFTEGDHYYRLDDILLIILH